MSNSTPKPLYAVQPAQHHTTKLTWTLILLATLFFTLLGSFSLAKASEAGWQGAISSMPTSGLEGEWVVAGRTFVADANTDFRQDKGAFAVNVCVEIEYVGSSSPYQATKIASKNSDDCSQSATPSPETETPEASTTPGVTGTPNATSTVVGGEREVYGKVESRPSPGLIGEWIVNGVSYNAAAGAEFDQDEGPLNVGACVKIHYSGSSEPFNLREIESEKSSRCNGSTATPDSTPGSTPGSTSTSTPQGEREVRGRVESLPDGLVGNWVVNGNSYTASDSTEFNQESGSFAVGVCVKIHFSGSSEPFTIREIESERSSRCGSGSATPSSTPEGTPGATPTATSEANKSEIYGILESFPDGLVGNWNIAGMTFVADGNTEFKERNGSFAVGITVKVHFSTDANGINQASEIETKFANDDDGHDDDGNGSHEGAEGHAYGAIDSFPSALQGNWSIAGIAYTADSASRFEQSDGSFAVGVNVKVEYYLDANDNRVIKKVETTSDSGGSSSSEHAKLFGFVDTMPTSGFVGPWTIDKIELVATTSSKFKEEDSLLGIGAYVEVEYSEVNGVKTIHEIEAHVPPGAGDDTNFGKIDDNGGTLNAASVQATVWVIGGVSYTVTPATDLNDAQGMLTVGQPVMINSYTAANGSQVATQVKAVTAIHQIFLPLTTR